MTNSKLRCALGAAFALATLGSAAMAQEVNIYSSRHYDSDDKLYAKFTEETGITVNRIEGEADELIARLEAEGDNSPADVFITVDIGRMGRAEEAGLLQPVESEVIENAVPAHLRDPENMWFGVSQRARIIFYSKDRVENPPRTYEALADEAMKGKICIRSSKNIYNQSLLASIIEADGEDAARDWAEGIVANMARNPEGGDTDQLRGLVSGECDVAVANHYYFLRGFDQEVDGLTEGLDGIGWVWPNQSDRGAHLNLAAAAMVKSAPNPDAAKTFLEFLTSEFAQQHFASQNNEYPAVPGIGLDEDTARLGFFIADNDTMTASFGDNAAKAQKIFNEVGWQ
ncbi:extracellular solute-binding protein [Roseovarius sp. SCSIO 43702]|uniref:extracellular solute-binding protein n=1 Tax=Roseovarius sp. SCSIO 43702 TaxID=2823043 RepID=UPI001C734C1D|nr:extracellular solute-binding protein [Roseovarius sp. SCSIO 43702]QYX56694.1 extracellular solute-binding protein [Roseovarius sp. SCSIO 43702]